MTATCASEALAGLPGRLYEHSRRWYHAKPELLTRRSRFVWLWQEAAEASALALRMAYAKAAGYRAQAIYAGVLSRAAVAYGLLGDVAERLSMDPAGNWLTAFDTLAIVLQVFAWTLSDWWAMRPRYCVVRSETLAAFYRRGTNYEAELKVLINAPFNPELN